MIGKMAISAALPGFNDLGLSVTLYFSFQKPILFTIISTLSKNNQKSMWEGKKRKPGQPNTS